MSASFLSFLKKIPEMEGKNDFLYGNINPKEKKFEIIEPVWPLYLSEIKMSDTQSRHTIVVKLDVVSDSFVKCTCI